MLETGIKAPEFKGLGYEYQEENSSEREYVFVKKD